MFNHFTAPGELFHVQNIYTIHCFIMFLYFIVLLFADYRTTLENPGYHYY